MTMTTANTMTTIKRRDHLFGSAARVLLFGGMAAAVALLSGCSDRPPTAVFGQSPSLLGAVRLNATAVNMTPGETLKLTAATYNSAGEATTEPVTLLRYTSTSIKLVTVADDGTLTALALTPQPVSIIAAATQGQVTQFDTVFVHVVDPPVAPPVSFGMKLEGDSTRMGVSASPAYWGVSGSMAYMMGWLLTAAGDTLPNLLFVYTTQDSRVIKTSRYQRNTYLQGVTPGKTWVYGSATLGSATFTDSVYVTVGWAAETYMAWNWNNTGRWGFGGTVQLVIQPGGVVWWENWGGGVSKPVIFDDPSAAEAESPGGDSGNIPAFSGSTNPRRRFTKVGTYTWHCTDAKGNDQVGQIIVKENPF